MGRGVGCRAVLMIVLVWGCLARAEGGTTPLGGACSLSTDCDDSSNVCLRAHPGPSGAEVWIDGYCTRTCSSDSPCAAGSTCVQVPDGPYCLKQCEADGECRSSYVCDAVSTGGSVCLSACGGDRDCASDFACRLCDGRCIPRQAPGALIGDPCTTDTQCATGQQCLHVNGHPQGLCSQPCGGSGCFSECPNGSTCQSVGLDRSASVCVRTCFGDSCGPQLQCAPFAQGASGCLPPCRTQADCPDSSTCNQGLCQTGSPVDAGCLLCGGEGDPKDGGSTPLPPPSPTGPTGSAGVSCGCEGSAVTAPGFLGALAVLFVAARRRRCPRP